jgi:hypothetical protein
MAPEHACQPHLPGAETRPPLELNAVAIRQNVQTLKNGIQCLSKVTDAQFCEGEVGHPLFRPIFYKLSQTDGVETRFNFKVSNLASRPLELLQVSFNSCLIIVQISVKQRSCFQPSGSPKYVGDHLNIGGNESEGQYGFLVPFVRAKGPFFRKRSLSQVSVMNTKLRELRHQQSFHLQSIRSKRQLHELLVSFIRFIVGTPHLSDGPRRRQHGCDTGQERLKLTEKCSRAGNSLNRGCANPGSRGLEIDRHREQNYGEQRHRQHRQHGIEKLATFLLHFIPFDSTRRDAAPLGRIA